MTAAERGIGRKPSIESGNAPRCDTGIGVCTVFSEAKVVFATAQIQARNGISPQQFSDSIRRATEMADACGPCPIVSSATVLLEAAKQVHQRQTIRQRQSHPPLLRV